MPSLGVDFPSMAYQNLDDPDQESIVELKIEPEISIEESNIVPHMERTEPAINLFIKTSPLLSNYYTNTKREYVVIFCY